MDFDVVLNMLDVPHTKDSAWYNDRKSKFIDLFQRTAVRYGENRNAVFNLCQEHTDEAIIYPQSDFILICPELLDLIELINNIENHFKTHINDSLLDEGYESQFETVEDFINWVLVRI